MVAGSTLYSWQKFVHFPAIDISEKKVELTGTVINDPYFSYKNQELVLETTYSGKSFLLLVKAPRHPKYAVGSKVAISGVIQEPGIIEDFDYKRYLRGKKIAYIMLTPKEVVALEGEPSLGAQLLRYLYSFRHIFEQSLNKSLHEPYSSLAVGIITGAKRSMPEELVSDLSVAGLTHIVALSGFNITIIIVAITALLAPFLNRKRLFLVGGLLVFAFVVMTGASASVVRAGIFSLLILLGKTLARKAYQTNILLLTALLMLVINPFILTDDIGFQLSFLAFCGIIYLSPAVKSSIEKSKLKILPEYIKGPLIETLSAQIMVLPLISFAFGKISLVAPISNILVLWIIPLAMFLTFVAAIIAWVVPALAGLSAYLAWPALYYIVIVSKLSSKLPWAMIEIDKSSYSVSIIFYLLIFIYWHSQKKMVRNEKQTL
jgi:competence protein ComEC